MLSRRAILVLPAAFLTVSEVRDPRAPGRATCVRRRRLP